MKKLIITTIMILAAAQLHAQRDIKTLNDLTTSQIIGIMGTPSEKILGTDPFAFSTELDDLRYGNARICIHNSSKGKHSVNYFETKSSNYCILSDIVSGGIKVGSKLSDIKKTKFASTAYGRNKSSNELMIYMTQEQGEYEIFGNKVNYVIYKSEFETVYLAVKNGKVTAWAYETKDDVPYVPYDYDNKLLK